MCEWCGVCVCVCVCVGVWCVVGGRGAGWGKVVKHDHGVEGSRSLVHVSKRKIYESSISTYLAMHDMVDKQLGCFYVMLQLDSRYSLTRGPEYVVIC